MGEFSKWLMHDDQKDLFEILFAVALNIFFLVLIALLLWSLGRPMLALRLASGYVVLWSLLCLVAGIVNRIHDHFKVNIYDHANAFVNSNLAVSCLLQTGWAAFVAQLVQNFVSGASLWMVVGLYVVGFLSCCIAFFVVSSFYQGHIYRLISLPLALVCYIMFSVWPASGRVLYGWFFDLFGARST
jgi:hypothetical protein